MRILLAGIVFSLLIFAVPGNVHASLIGDEVHATITFKVNNNIVLDETKIVDGTVEFENVFSSSAAIRIDVDEKTISIIYSAAPTGTLFTPHIFVIDDLDWIGQQGQILGVFGVSNPDNISIDSITTTAHSITIEAGNVQIPGQETIRFDVTLDVSHAVGGSPIPIDTTALLLAGTQMTAVWMIPAIVAAIGIGIVLARKF